MKLSHRGRAPEPGRRERGAALVELAIVAVILVTMLGGAFDLGMAWRGTLAVTEGARAGVRVGSAVGVQKEADRDLLLSVKSALSSSDMIDKVVRIVVFRAGTNGRVPAECKTATTLVSGCNILTGDDLRALETTSPLEDNGCIKQSRSKGFCPLTRKDLPAEADSIGIWIRAEHPNLFPIMGQKQTIERTAVMRIEPRNAED